LKEAPSTNPADQGETIRKSATGIAKTAAALTEVAIQSERITVNAGVVRARALHSRVRLIEDRDQFGTQLPQDVLPLAGCIPAKSFNIDSLIRHCQCLRKNAPAALWCLRGASASLCRCRATASAGRGGDHAAIAWREGLVRAPAGPRA